jgi:hypothetical protein
MDATAELFGLRPGDCITPRVDALGWQLTADELAVVDRITGR